MRSGQHLLATLPSHGFGFDRQYPSTHDPRHTSQRCNKCGHTEKANRKNQAEFECKSCGHTDHADCNGAKNIRDKGLLSTSLSASATTLLKSA